MSIVLDDNYWVLFNIINYLDLNILGWYNVVRYLIINFGGVYGNRKCTGKIY